MFGLKIFSKTKTRKFASDKDRKQYYAIREYYKPKPRADRVELKKNSSDKKK